jgi:hypothetical protein
MGAPILQAAFVPVQLQLFRLILIGPRQGT